MYLPESETGNFSWKGSGLGSLFHGGGLWRQKGAFGNKPPIVLCKMKGEVKDQLQGIRVLCLKVRQDGLKEVYILDQSDCLSFRILKWRRDSQDKGAEGGLFLQSGYLMRDKG